MTRTIIQTESAPAAIGTYSQAVKMRAGSMTFISGQIPLVPETMTLISDTFIEQTHQVFKFGCGCAGIRRQPERLHKANYLPHRPKRICQFKYSYG